MSPFLAFLFPPFLVFLIVRRYAGLGPGTGSIHSKDLYFFDKGSARLYDTLERFGEDALESSYTFQGSAPGSDSVPVPPSVPAVKLPSLVGQAECWPPYKR